MNVSIIGPEGSGKTRLAEMFAKKAASGRPVYVLGELKSKIGMNITPEQYAVAKNCVVIIDDANAFLDNYELNRKDSPYRKPMVMHRHWNRLNIYVFHSMDDAIKPLFRQSRYIFISSKYKDDSFKRNKFIKGISPTEIGRKPYSFMSYKRY
jgi:hypothetical protein